MRTTASALVSVPALSVWIRGRIGQTDCKECRGRRADARREVHAGADLSSQKARR